MLLIYSEIGGSGGTQIIEMLPFSVGPLGFLWLELSKITQMLYTVKSVILRAYKSPKCYVYSEISDSGGTKITQMIRK